ncbi:MAG: helix-turn-helix domain-containing protein [Chloroflexota bacterium]
MKGLTLNQREQARVQIMNRVLEGWVRVSEAAEIMGVSERHAWRLLAAYRKEGAAALAHGNRGRSPVQKTSEGLSKKVLELIEGPYQGFNHCHLTDMLAEREGIVLSRSTVRRILTARGMKSPRQRRPSKHRCRRERYAQEGMLLQIDGSRHDWLEGRGPYLTLVGAIDPPTADYGDSSSRPVPE